MSRIGLKPIALRAGVEVRVANGMVSVKGPKATLEEPIAPHTRVEVRDGEAVVIRESELKAAKAAHGLMRSLLANMLVGVTDGFQRTMEIIGVGYRAEVKGDQITLSVGYSHPVVMQVPSGLSVRSESPTRFVISGADKQRVGQFAANVREIRPPEPYKGKGIRYADEIIRRKVGKSAGA
jgi:large subunit ribosomal protein L6